MGNLTVEGRITVMLAGAVYAPHVALSTYSMCLFCMLKCSPDIERRLCSLLDNKTLSLIIYKLFPSLPLLRTVYHSKLSR